MTGSELALIIRARDEATKTLNHIGKETEGLGSKFTAFGKVAAAGFAIGGAAAVGFGAITVNAAAGFEQAMANVKAVSGATAEEVAALDKLALKLGKDTVFSAKQAAQGMEEMVKGGISVADTKGPSFLRQLLRFLENPINLVRRIR